MNILQLLSQHDSYDAVMGTLDLSKHLMRKGHHCVIASSRDVTSLAYDTSGVLCETLAPLARSAWRLSKAYYRIREIVKKNNIEIIHAHSPVMSWLALFVARAEAVPYVSTCYDFYARNYLHESLGLGKSVIVHHEAIGGHLVETFGMSYQHLRFIKQRLDLSSFEFRSSDLRSKTDFTIVLTWPLRPHMGYESFLKGMVTATRIIPNVKILIADTMPQSKQNYKRDLALFIRRLGIGRYIEFFDASQLNLAIVSRCNVIVSPFIKEAAHTRPLLEAYAYGTLVIASRVAGIAEIVHDNITGILVPPNDHQVLAQAVTQILRDSARTRNIVSAARRKVEEEHSLTTSVGEFIDVYQEAIRHKRILIINVGTIGEVVRSVPAVRLLKKHMHGAHITSLSRSPLRSLFQHCPYIDELLVCDFFRRGGGGTHGAKILGVLLRGRFDIVVDFTNTLSTQLLSYTSLASERYGYRNRILKFLVNRGIQKVDTVLDPVGERLRIIRQLVRVGTGEQKIEFWPSREENIFVERLLQKHWVGETKIIGLDISSSKNILANGVSLDHFAYLCDALAHNDMRVVLVGLNVATAKINELTRRIRSKPIVATGDISVMQFISLMKRCDLYIGSNVDLLQLAMTLRIPSLILSATKRTQRHLFAQKDVQGVELLTKSDLQLAMNTRRRRRQGAVTSHRNVVLDKINRLIQTPQ